MSRFTACLVPSIHVGSKRIQYVCLFWYFHCIQSLFLFPSSQRWMLWTLLSFSLSYVFFSQQSALCLLLSHILSLLVFPSFLVRLFWQFFLCMLLFSPHYSTFPPDYECSPDTINLIGTLLLTLTVLKHNSSRELKWEYMWESEQACLQLICFKGLLTDTVFLCSIQRYGVCFCVLQIWGSTNLGITFHELMQITHTLSNF